MCVRVYVMYTYIYMYIYGERENSYLGPRDTWFLIQLTILWAYLKIQNKNNEINYYIKWKLNSIMYLTRSFMDSWTDSAWPPHKRPPSDWHSYVTPCFSWQGGHIQSTCSPFKIFFAISLSDFNPRHFTWYHSYRQQSISKIKCVLDFSHDPGPAIE